MKYATAQVSRQNNRSVIEYLGILWTDDGAIITTILPDFQTLCDWERECIEEGYDKETDQDILSTVLDRKVIRP